MKKLISIVVLLFSMVITAQTVKQEKKAIKNVITTAYVEGLMNEGNNKKIDFGIHPDFRILEYKPSFGLRIYSLSEWKSNNVIRKRTGLLPRKQDNLVSIKFKRIDITGTAAIAKVKFYSGKKFLYIDYIGLYKFKEGWKMVNKIFYKFN